MTSTEKKFDSNEFCYCELMNQKVFKKDKCPYYENSERDLLKSFTD